MSTYSCLVCKFLGTELSNYDDDPQNLGCLSCSLGEQLASSRYEVDGSVLRDVEIRCCTLQYPTKKRLESSYILFVQS